MAAPTGSLFSTQSVRIEEIINKKIGMFLPACDKVWEDMIVSNQSVGPQDSFGRDFLIIKTFMQGLTGVVEPGGPKGDFTLYGDPQNTALGAKLHLQGLSNVFPDATLGANQTPYRLSIPMRSMHTNLMMTLGELQAEATQAFIGEVIAPKLEGFAKHISQTLCNYFYISQNDYYSLGSLGGTTASGTDRPSSSDDWALTDSNKTIILNVTRSTYAIDRFMIGMRVQFYDSTGATQRTVVGSTSNSTFIVVAVDELSGHLHLKEAGNLALNSTNFVSNLASGDLIVMASSKGNANTPYSASGGGYFTGIAGINSWLKGGDTGGSTRSASNTLLGYESAGTNSGYSGDINVNIHPEFRSMTYSLAGQPLTEHFMRKLLRRWHAAKGKYGYDIDTLVASDGVWLAYEAQKIGRQYYDRTGKTSTMNNEGSTGDFQIQMDGRTYRGLTSSYIEAGTVYGHKFKGNWKRFSPPDPKGVKKGERLPAWIPFRFVGAALTGNGSNQIPIFATSANRTFITEGTQLPGFLRMQLVPDQVCGLKLTNVAEDRLYT
jgi:hypothetical protein